MKYAYFADSETEGSRNFNFMLLLGALFLFSFVLSSNSTVSYYPHFAVNSHFLQISQALPLFVCLFMFQ